MSQNRFQKRRTAASHIIRKAGLDGIVLEDIEGRRNTSIRYLTGLPQDGMLFLFADGLSVLVPWDVTMAEKTADADRIIPLTSFERKPVAAIRGVLESEGYTGGPSIEISGRTPYPVFSRLREELKDISLSCPEQGVEGKIEDMRARKDGDELQALRAAASITNEALEELAERFEKGELTTELEVASFLETFGRSRGAEGMGFETLAAGPSRSFGIHAFPSCTTGPIGSNGLSILDFGFRMDGYTSDVTITLVRGVLSGEQRRMIELVQHAYDAAAAAVGPGVMIRDICRIVDDIFSRAHFTMPHGLGHGIGLDAHEKPTLSSRISSEEVLEPGMVITIEPGLYSPASGGVRLENDLLITPDGAQVLTNARILYLRSYD